jgi:hypothetical protein
VKRTETKGQPPNYFTLHCPSGDGFIWRTDDTSEPWRDWSTKHDGHGERADGE